jgi:50S ribosomal protein L3
MALGLVGRKVGMTRVFGEKGEAIPVTVLEVSTNYVAQKKSEMTDGYNAVQVSFGSKKANRVNKPQAGHFAKAGIEAGRGLLEFRVDESRLQELQVGNPFDVNLFTNGQFVDVTAVSKGKGFSGNIKRHNFRSQRASHGNSLSHRAPGSIGQCQDPGRVFKGKKMPGRLGGKSVTTQNLVVIRVDEGKKLLLIKGAVPGAVNARVVIRPSVKKGAI